MRPSGGTRGRVGRGEASAEASEAAPVRRPRGQVPADVFSTIFGDSQAPLEPLNPKHRSDAGGEARSYQRRKK